MQKKYLAQVYNVGTDLSKGIYDQLPKPAFEFGEVEELSKTAHEWYKECEVPAECGRAVDGVCADAACVQLLRLYQT